MIGHTVKPLHHKAWQWCWKGTLRYGLQVSQNKKCKVGSPTTNVDVHKFCTPSNCPSQFSAFVAIWHNLCSPCVQMSLPLPKRLCNHNCLFVGPIANLKGHHFQPSLSVCLSVCLWPALLPFNTDRFWWNLVTRTLLWSSLAATIMVQIGRRQTWDIFLKISNNSQKSQNSNVKILVHHFLRLCLLCIVKKLDSIRTKLTEEIDFEVCPYDDSGNGTAAAARRSVGYSAKLIWILIKQEMMGWQWHQLDHMQSFAPCSRQTTMLAPHHSFFTERILFLMPTTNSVKVLKALRYALNIAIFHATYCAITKHCKNIKFNTSDILLEWA